MTEPDKGCSELQEALSAGLEGMAFEAPELTSEEEFDWEADDLLWASIDAENPPLGRISIVFPKSLATELASAILGDPDECTEEATLDALAELMNTVGGLWLAKMSESGNAIQLGLPKVGRGRCEEARSASHVWAYDIDYEYFALTLQND